MKKVKLGTRIEKAVNAFFEDENLNENSSLGFVSNTKMSELRDTEELIENSKPYKTYLKQAFLFFPGTFFLFYISLGLTLSIKDILISFRADRFFSKNLFLFCLVVLLSFFMPWVGLGDFKNKKHLAIPSSIILSGIIIGVIVNLTEHISRISQGITNDFGYAIWLFPIALIVPFLAKGWVDKKVE